jgi:hypothetical protein
MRLIYSAALISLLLTALPARAEITAATGIMALSNSTHQGGQGTEGSTFLSQTDISYHGSWWALGAFFQYDKQGKSEIDTASGPRMEIFWKVFYLDYAYGIQMNRSYNDRAIAEQTGSSSTLGLGTRFNLTGSTTEGSGLKGVFLQFSYKIRTQTVKKQDSRDLSEPIIQKDGYPLFGIGFGF